MIDLARRTLRGTKRRSHIIHADARLRHLYTSLIFALFAWVSVSYCTHAQAGQEYRKPSLTWRLWGGDAADFDSPEAAFAAWDAAGAAVFDACSAKNCESCTKNSYTGTSRLGPYPVIINGQRYSVGTDSGTSTYYNPACTVDYGGGNVVTYPPSGPTTVTNNAGIAAVAIQRCAPGWAITRNRSLGTQTIDGQSVPVYEQDCGKEIPQPCLSCTRFGNPIDAVAASKLASETDYVSADGALLVRRTYSSIAGQWFWGHDDSLADFTGRNISRPVSSVLSGYVSAVPAGMYIYYSLPTPPAVPRAQSWPLTATDWDNPQKEVSVFSGGRHTVFVEGGVGAFSTTALTRPGLSVATVAGSSQWTLRSPDRGYEIFDSTGLLIKQVARDGKVISYTRQGTSMTVTVSPSGRSLVYSVTNQATPVGSFDTIILPDASALHYGLDVAGLIGAVTYADGSQTVRVYDEPANMGTADAKSWLTGLVDENGVRQATYTYDASAPHSTGLAGGVGTYSFTFGGSYTQVTAPAPGGVSTLYWENGPDGERRLTDWLQPAGAGSAAGGRTLTYDANGNKASESDFNTGLVCYVSDLTRNLETTRIEGLTTAVNCSPYTPANAALPAGSRKVSTQWHPDWRLESKVAEPGRITTSVYNGQPDPFNGGAAASCAPSTALLPDGKPVAVLCKQVQQATTDVDGHLGFSTALQSGVVNRVSQWTYNQYGQVLTAKDPLNNTTTYAYYAATSFSGADPNAVGHTIGDLQTVTNAKRQVTTYSQYNKHGQPLQSSDPNGVVTTNTYDLRQRLLSTSVGGQSTSYSYDPAGQLLKITAPDASWFGYEYDPAHRLTATKDNLGNRIEYTLDNAGNKAAENVKDPLGNLARTLARSIDALGRVQQTTGRE